MRRLVGIGYRRPLAAWIDGRPPQVDCLEVTAEHFFEGGLDRLRALRRAHPLFVHGLGLSLGTPGPLDRDPLERFVRVVEAADPEWISEHVAFTRAGGIDLGHLNPIPRTGAALRVMADHAKEVADRCGRKLILENIASHLALPGQMSEPEFLNRLCDLAGCGLLLDVTNLFVNSRNHRYDPSRWIEAIEPGNVVQLHAVGYTVREGRWHDEHAEPIQRDLLDVVREAVARTSPRAVIVERDENIPDVSDLAAELESLHAVA